MNKAGGASPLEIADESAKPCTQAVAEASVLRVGGAEQSTEHLDLLAVEEPLEIRVGHEVEGRRVHSAVSITMRTPGDDHDLAVGFLYTESIITDAGQVRAVRHCRSTNVVRVDLESGVHVDLGRLQRNFYTSSSCGVCGKTSLEAVQACVGGRVAEAAPMVDGEVVHRLPEALRKSQDVFARTGGLHAAALFDAEGRICGVREDVGRHNALDKLIGAQLLAGRTTLADRLLLVSGRASFELVQKAAAAGIPVLAAVGAPSSLAVSLAQSCGMTLIGFCRQDRFNIYCGAERVRLPGR